MGRRPGFGNVERLSSGRFRARYPGPDGRRYTAPTTFVTKSEARGWLSLQHAEITRKRVGTTGVGAERRGHLRWLRAAVAGPAGPEAQKP